MGNKKAFFCALGPPCLHATCHAAHAVQPVALCELRCLALRALLDALRLAPPATPRPGPIWGGGRLGRLGCPTTQCGGGNAPHTEPRVPAKPNSEAQLQFPIPNSRHSPGRAPKGGRLGCWGTRVAVFWGALPLGGLATQMGPRKCTKPLQSPATSGICQLPKQKWPKNVCCQNGLFCRSVPPPNTFR